MPQNDPMTPQRLREIAMCLEHPTVGHPVAGAELRAHAEQLERNGEWRDISTAPKDGTEFIGYFPTFRECHDPTGFPPRIAIALWRELSPTVNWELVDEAQELWRRVITTPAFFESNDGDLIDPTHWRPLPNPPEAK